MRSRLAAIVELSEDAILSKNLDGIILTWNRAAEKMYGYSAAEIVGRSISLLFPPERLGEVSTILEQLKRGERRDIHETVRVRKDGTRIDVSLSISPMPEATGRVTAASVIARDITERKRRERRLATEHGVTSALAESATLEGAAPTVLKTVGETLGCDLGVLWEVGVSPEVLRCVAVWRPPGIAVTDFEQHSRQIAFARGEGLPGRAWDSGEPVWISDAPFPRSVAAQRNEPCGALAFPLRSNGDVLGVVEFFSPELRQPQKAVLAMMASIGVQVGQFIERRNAVIVLHARDREFQLAPRFSRDCSPKLRPPWPASRSRVLRIPPRKLAGTTTTSSQCRTDTGGLPSAMLAATGSGRRCSYRKLALTCATRTHLHGPGYRPPPPQLSTCGGYGH